MEAHLFRVELQGIGEAAAGRDHGRDGEKDWHLPNVALMGLALTAYQ